MKLLISNTGVSITFTVDEELYRHFNQFPQPGEDFPRVEATYNRLTRRMLIQPSPDGRKISRRSHDPSSGGFFSYDPTSPVRRSWPTFNLIKFEDIELLDNGAAEVHLPEQLPPLSPFKARQAKERRAMLAQRSTPVPAVQPSLDLQMPREANLLMQVNGKTYAYAVPDDVLLDTALDFTRKGYAS